MTQTSRNVKNWWKAFWLAADIFACAAFLWGKQGQTISARLADARAAGRKLGCIGCKMLNLMFREKDHCSGAVIGDIKRAKAVLEDMIDIPLPPEYEEEKQRILSGKD